MSTQEVSADCVQLLLSSGQIWKVRAIELYPAEQIAKIAGLRAQAAQKMGGISTGLGFIGSPAWAVGAGAVLGVLEAALSESSKKQALPIIKHAEELTMTLRSIGQLFHIESIKHIERPDPSAWSASTVASQRISENTLWGGQVHTETEVTINFIHSGDEFLNVQVDEGLVIGIRWSGVIGYVAPGRGKPSESL